MEPKEYAKELFDKMEFHIKWNAQPSTVNGVSKQCALIAVDAIINECYMWNGNDNVVWETKRFDYWNEVKQEIEKL